MELTVLANIMKFLERVQITGSEAFAWIEAYQAIQNEITNKALPK